MPGRPILAAPLATVVLGVIALVSVWTQQPLLAPSLGSAVFVQVMSPTEASARAWNTAMGQIIGVAAGLTGVFVAGATLSPIFMSAHPLVLARVLAVVIAVPLTVLLESALRANSPAGGATAVLLAIGAETPDLSGTGRLLIGIGLVTALGEAARWLVLRAR